jgi:hypothetical protein
MGSDDNLSIQAKLSDTNSGNKDLGSIDMDTNARKDHNPTKGKIPMGNLKNGLGIGSINKQKFINMPDHSKITHGHGIDLKHYPKQAYDTADAPRPDEGQSSARHVAGIQSSNPQQMNSNPSSHPPREGYIGSNQGQPGDPSVPGGQYYQQPYPSGQKPAKERGSKQSQQPLAVNPTDGTNGGNELLSRLRENKGGQLPAAGQMLPQRTE